MAIIDEPVLEGMPHIYCILADLLIYRWRALVISAWQFTVHVSRGISTTQRVRTRRTSSASAVGVAIL